MAVSKSTEEKINNGIRKEIESLLHQGKWKEVTEYVNSMPEAWKVWVEVWAVSGMTWPEPIPQGYYTKDDLNEMGRLQLRRMMVCYPKSEISMMSADRMINLIAAQKIERPPLPPPPMPIPPYEERKEKLLDYLAELDYHTFHINSRRYAEDCIRTYRAILYMCEDYGLVPEEVLWERDWEAAPTAEEMFERNNHYKVYEKIKNGQPYSEMLHPSWANQQHGEGYWENNWEEEYYRHFRSSA